MVKRMGSILLWSVVIYGMYCAMLFVLQRKMLFPAELAEVSSQSEINLRSLEKEWISFSDGKAEMWYIPPVPGSAEGRVPAAIFAHGNAEVIDYWPEEFAFLTRAGVGLCLLEYPGYGRSEGSPSQESIGEVFRSAYDLLVKRPEIDPDRIIYIGRSLGGGAVCQLALERPPAAMILMSTFTSVRFFAKSYLAPGFLVRDPFDNLSAMKQYSGPVLIIHGGHDEVIPYRHAQKLHEAASDSRLITYKSGHNDCPPNARVFEADVLRFLRHKGVVRDG